MSHRSSTSRAPHDRETQIIMHRSRPRSSSVSTRVAVVGLARRARGSRRCRRCPPRTRTAADAGLLDDVEDRAAPAARSGWPRCAPAPPRTRSSRTGALSVLGGEPLDVQRAARPGRAALLDRVEQRLRPAAVDQRVGSRGAEQRVEVEQAGLVLRARRAPGRRSAASSSRNAIEPRRRPPYTSPTSRRRPPPRRPSAGSG